MNTVKVKNSGVGTGQIAALVSEEIVDNGNGVRTKIGIDNLCLFTDNNESIQGVFIGDLQEKVNISTV